MRREAGRSCLVFRNFVGRSIWGWTWPRTRSRWGSSAGVRKSRWWTGFSTTRGRADVLHVAGDGPAVPERVDDERVPVTVELVLRGALHGRAALDRPCHRRVHVLDVDELEHRSTRQATGRRSGRTPLPVLVLDDDRRVADLDLGVRHRAVRAGEAHPLARAEH